MGTINIGMYRNVVDIFTPTGDCVEAGSLFERQGDTMVLVDEDRYVAVPYDNLLFSLVE